MKLFLEAIKVEVIPTGNLNLKLGFIYQNTENPQISEENRSSFTFDFDQQINSKYSSESWNAITVYSKL